MVLPPIQPIKRLIVNTDIKSIVSVAILAISNKLLFGVLSANDPLNERRTIATKTKFAVAIMEKAAPLVIFNFSVMNEINGMKWDTSDEYAAKYKTE